MRKGFTISMLLILFYTQLGYYGQFMILQWRMKEAAREAWLTTLPDAQLYRISLADMNATGRWEEEGRECWFRGHLYDVIRRGSTGGMVYLFCLDDEREAQLIHQSVDVTRANQDHPGKKDTHPYLWKIGDLLPAEETAHSNPSVPVRQPDPSFPQHRLPTRYADISVPPPKKG